MSSVPAFGVQPRRQWPLWLVLVAGLAWAGAALAAIFAHHDGVLAAAAALCPPLIVIFLAASLVPAAGRRPDVDDIEARLSGAASGAAQLETYLQGVDAALARCADQTARLAESASADGQGLLASAASLRAAGEAVVAASGQAERSATTLLAAMPGIARQGGEIDSVLRQLGTDATRQVRAIESMLITVRARGVEAESQADSTVARLTKLLADIDGASRRTTDDIAKRAYALDAAATGVLERTTAVLESAGEQLAVHAQAVEQRLTGARSEIEQIAGEGARRVGQRLDLLLAAAGQLRQLFATHEEQTERVFTGTDQHLAGLPARLDALRAAGEQAVQAVAAGAESVHTQLADLRTPIAASAAGIRATSEQVVQLRAAADDLAAGLDAQLPATAARLREFEAAAAALTAEAALLDSALTAGVARAAEAGSQIGDANAHAQALSDDTLTRLAAQLAAALGSTAELAAAIRATVPIAEQAHGTVADQLASLHTRLGHVHADGLANLDALAERSAAAHEDLNQLALPLEHARGVLGDMEGQLSGLAVAADDLGRGLDAQLPKTAAALQTLIAGAATLLDRVDALRAAMADGAATIGDASQGFAHQQTALTAAAAALAGHFEAATGQLDRLRAEAGMLAAETADQIDPQFARIRALADESAGAMRAVLSGVVAETSRALDAAGAASAETAFGAPIRIQLAAIEDASARADGAAQGAALRIAGETASLGRAVDALEAKVAEMDTRLDVRARDTLSARSTRLLGMLQEASVDVAGLLSIDAGEGAWMRYLRGDRSLFARRTARLIDRETITRIARHYTYDVRFQEEATRYLEIFETLTRRLLSDPDGEALTAAMVSSDLGKVYVAIARATGRWRPAA